MEMQDETNPFLPKLLLVLVFVTAIETPSKTTEEAVLHRKKVKALYRQRQMGRQEEVPISFESLLPFVSKSQLLLLPLFLREAHVYVQLPGIIPSLAGLLFRAPVQPANT